MESFVYLLFILLVCSYCQKAEEGPQGLVYYVTATGADCPLVHQQYCQSLNDFANQSHWPTESNNVTFLFLPGEHSFKGKFKIKGVNYVALKGIESQFESRAMINCETIDINSVSTFFIENLKIASLTMLNIENTTDITVSKVSSQTLYISVSSSVTILQSEFIANSPYTMVYLSHISNIIFIQDVVVVSSRIVGMCFYSSISSNDNFIYTLKDSIIICWDQSGIYISSNVLEESSKSLLQFSNVTLGSNYANSYISVNFDGNIKLTDVEIFNASGVKLSSRANPISLERVYFTDSTTGLLIRANLGHVYLTDVSLMNTGGLHIGYCDVCYFKHLKVSNGTNGVIVNSAKTSATLMNCTIANNSKTGFRIKGQAQVIFSEHPSYILDNTSPVNGGGFWISQGITMSFIAQVFFARNVAKGVGGAIYVDNDVLSNNKDKDCTLKYKHRITSYFWDNYGELGGNDIYGGFYWDCCYKPFGTNCKKATSSEHLFRKQVNCQQNQMLNISSDQKNLPSKITSDPIGVCICGMRNETICHVRKISVETYPGQFIYLSLATVGVCGGFSPGELVTSKSNYIDVLLQDTNQETSGKHCKNFTYKIEPHLFNKTGSFFLHYKGNPGGSYLEGSSLSISVSFLSCPLGLVLSENKCQCSNIIRSINGTQCSIHWIPHPIRRSGNNWLSYNEEYNCTVAHNNCPFDYCNTSTVYLNLTHPDLQCTNGRSGILCGECQQGLSLMLGSNKCESCTDDYLLLVIGFILAGVALVIFLLVCNLTVSVGSINGLLFYANLVKLNEAALFPNGASIPVLSQFIAWLNLDLGIETCFFNGLDGYWKTWLQFVFPLYIWLLIGIIIIACYYSGKVSRLCGNNAVPVLATLILMSYNKLLRAITNSSMFVMIKCEATKMQWSVWSVDGNINYLSSKHTPLLLIALLFLLIGLLYTGLVFSIQWLQRYSGKCCHKSSHDPVVRLKPFLDAYTGPYKNKYRYWTGLLLIIRLLLTTVFSYTTGTMPQINNYIISFITSVLLILSKGVYRKRYLNILEIFHLLNLGSLCLFNGLSDHMGYGCYTTVILTTASVSMSLLAFIATLIVHLFKKICSNYHCVKKRERDELFLQNKKEEEYSPADIVINRREPLIFEF